MSCPKSDLVDCLPKSVQQLLGDFCDADEVMIEAEDYIDALHIRIGELEAFNGELRDDLDDLRSF